MDPFSSFPDLVSLRKEKVQPSFGLHVGVFTVERAKPNNSDPLPHHVYISSLLRLDLSGSENIWQLQEEKKKHVWV